MKIYSAENYEDLSRKAANIVSAQIIMKPDCTLGLATGSTPEGLYAQLVEWYKKGDLDFSGVRSINLDEYKGLAGSHPQSYRYFMDSHLFDHVNIKKKTPTCQTAWRPIPTKNVCATTLFLQSPAALISSSLASDAMDISALTNPAKPLKKRPTVSR